MLQALSLLAPCLRMAVLRSGHPPSLTPNPCLPTVLPALPHTASVITPGPHSLLAPCLCRAVRGGLRSGHPRQVNLCNLHGVPHPLGHIALGEHVAQEAAHKLGEPLLLWVQGGGIGGR